MFRRFSSTLPSVSAHAVAPSFSNNVPRMTFTLRGRA